MTDEHSGFVSMLRCQAYAACRKSSLSEDLRRIRLGAAVRPLDSDWLVEDWKAEGEPMAGPGHWDRG